MRSDWLKTRGVQCSVLRRHAPWSVWILWWRPVGVDGMQVLQFEQTNHGVMARWKDQDPGVESEPSLRLDVEIAYSLLEAMSQEFNLASGPEELGKLKGQLEITEEWRRNETNLLAALIYKLTGGYDG